MPEYLSPGVYVEEISTGPKPIEGVSTSTAGFVGIAERGPERPTLVTSWLEYQRYFGGHDRDRSFLPFAVEGFFRNGGKRCYVARVASATAGFAHLSLGTLRIAARGRGSWGNDIRIKLLPAGNGVPDQRKAQIFFGDTPGPLEEFDGMTHDATQPNHVARVLNATSAYVVAWVAGEPTPLPVTSENEDATPLRGGSDGAKVGLADWLGDEGLLPLTAPDSEHAAEDLLGRGRGLAGLNRIDTVSLLAAPDSPLLEADGEKLDRALVDACEKRKDRFALVATPAGQSDVNQVHTLTDSSYGAIYYPWIKVLDPGTNGTVAVPPVGHVAGICARTDIERGVHKAPANEVVRGATDLEFPVTKAMQDVLNPNGVNCIRDFRTDGRGIRLWGARTMSRDPGWKYVNVRRLFLFIEQSIHESTQWVVFEPNHEPTWAKVLRSITAFLVRVWRNGALSGFTQDEAFFVKCDRTTMTQDDIDNGRLICLIGIAPIKPAEFVIFRIQQKTIEATD